MTEDKTTPDPIGLSTRRSPRPPLEELPLFIALQRKPGEPPRGRVRSTWKMPTAEAAETAPEGEAPSETPQPSVAKAWAPRAVPASDLVRAAQAHPRSDIDWKLVAALRVQVSERLADARAFASWDAAEQHRQGWQVIRKLLDEDAADTLARGEQIRPAAEQEALARAVFDAVFRMGRLQPLLDNPRIENIMITRCDRVMVEYDDGTLGEVDPVAESDEELAEFLAFVSARSDNPRPFDRANPTLHLKLADGARRAADLHTAWISVVIRRHRVVRVTLDDLVERGTLSPVMADFLKACVKARKSIVVSGIQGAGKTTLVRALCAEIDPNEPIGTFETEYELFLHELLDQHRVVHAWEARSGSGERGPDGRIAGERGSDEQIHSSFRFSLARQIIGEIRGKEVWQMVLLMESGPGSISTTHAATAQATMRKLVTCAMQAGPQVSQELAALKLADTIDIVVHLNCDIVPATGDQLARKHRYVSEILEITPGEHPRGYGTNTIFSRLPGRCAVANTRPDSLWDDLIAAGFNALGFERELSENRRGA